MTNYDAESTLVVAPTRHRRRPGGDRSTRSSSSRHSVSSTSSHNHHTHKSIIIGILKDGRRNWLSSALLAFVLVLVINPYNLFTIEQHRDRRRLLRDTQAAAPKKELSEVLAAYSVEQAAKKESEAPEVEAEASKMAIFVEPLSDQDVEDILELNRMLMEGLDAENLQELTVIPDALNQNDAQGEGNGEPRRIEVEVTEKTNEAARSSQSASGADYETLISASKPLPTYDLPSLLSQINLFSNTFAVIVYDPPTDEFYALYSKKHYWSSSVEKMIRALSSVTDLIRQKFGNRLGTVDELAFGISAGDYPAVKITDCVKVNSHAATKHEQRLSGQTGSSGCSSENAPPILHFGSTFRHQVFPNMISMPMPESHHLQCYEYYATRGEVCPNRKRLARVGEHGLFGEGTRFDWSASSWDGLVPQVVWRGTDFAYLQTLYPEIGRPSLDSHIAPHLDRLSTINLKQQAVDALVKSKTSLVPRWKGVLHTAQAELDAELEIEKVGRNENEKKRMKTRMLPWANIKFSHFVSQKGVKTPTKGSAEYRMWERMNFPAAGDNMDLEALAKYRYHIDLGGGGGTTWSGTIQKLALPGLLFHHVTPTKDYIHDYMKPWKHYVPVAPDLRDLKEKYDWAESHPNQARKIAERGTRLARYWSSAKGMEEMLKKDIVDPMRAVFDAYVPVRKTEHQGKTWRKVIMETVGEGNMLPILKCTGKSANSCERMVGKGGFFDQAQIRRLENAVAASSGR